MNDKSVPLPVKLENLSKMTNNFKNLYSDFDLEREQEFARNFTLAAYLERLMQGVENMLDHFKEERFEILSSIAKYQLDILNNAEKIKSLGEKDNI